MLEWGRLLLSHGHDIGQLLIFSQNENVRLVGMWLARGGKELDMVKRTVLAEISSPAAFFFFFFKTFFFKTLTPTLNFGRTFALFY